MKTKKAGTLFIVLLLIIVLMIAGAFFFYYNRLGGQDGRGKFIPMPPISTVSVPESCILSPPFNCENRSTARKQENDILLYITQVDADKYTLIKTEIKDCGVNNTEMTLDSYEIKMIHVKCSSPLKEPVRGDIVIDYKKPGVDRIMAATGRIVRYPV
jgi:hypothetical protein